jgi:hypothetical protein
LILEIPGNTRQMLDADDLEASEEAYEGKMSEDLIKMRRKAFADELVAIAYDFYKEKQDSDNDNDDTASIVNWPEDFDVE